VAAALVVAAAGVGSWLTLNQGPGHPPDTQQGRSQAAVALTGSATAGPTLSVTISSSGHPATAPATHSATRPATPPATHPVTVPATHPVTVTATPAPRPRPTPSAKTTAPAATTFSVSVSGAAEYACGTVVHSPFKASSIWLFTFIDHSSADIGVYSFGPSGTLFLQGNIGPGETLMVRTVRGQGWKIQGPHGCLAVLEITAAGQATVS